MKIYAELVWIDRRIDKTYERKFQKCRIKSRRDNILDFYENPDNDGNYKIVLWNRRPKFDWDGDEEITFMDQYGQPMQVTIPFMIDLTEENTVHVKAGDRLVQGLFIKTLPADEGQSDVVRTGGIGHTGK